MADIINRSTVVAAKRPNNNRQANGCRASINSNAGTVAASRANLGIGARANDAQRMMPARFGGFDAATEIAIGPENDSPNNTNGSVAGNSRKTCCTSSKIDDTIVWIAHDLRRQLAAEEGQHWIEQIARSIHAGQEN